MSSKNSKMTNPSQRSCYSENTEENEEEEQRISWHPLRIEPRRLVITGDKPTAVFKVKNRADADIKMFITVPNGKLDISYEGEPGPPELGPIYRKTVRSQEVVEVHVVLTPVELEKLNTEGLTDEEIQVEYVDLKDISSMSKELIRVVFSDKEISEEERELDEKRRKEDEERWVEEQKKWPGGRKSRKQQPMSPMRRKSGRSRQGSKKNTSSYEKSTYSTIIPITPATSTLTKPTVIIAKSPSKNPVKSPTVSTPTTKTTPTVTPKSPKNPKIDKKPRIIKNPKVVPATPPKKTHSKNPPKNPPKPKKNVPEDVVVGKKKNQNQKQKTTTSPQKQKDKNCVIM